MDIEPVEATFGAVVRGVDLRSIDGCTFDAIHEAWLEHALLIFPGQHLSRDEQNAFARRFGPLEFDAAPVTNIADDGTIETNPDTDLLKSVYGTHGWHHDSTFLPVQAKGAVFTAEIVPEGGADTRWADMRAGYDALDAETRDLIRGLSAHHSLHYSMGRAGLMPDETDDKYGYHDGEPPLRPLVKIHPETGRLSLNIGSHAHNVVGMDEAASEHLLDRINHASTRPPRVHQREWTPGDAAIWDNRCLMHQGVPYDMTQPRRMWHSRIAGDPSSELALNYSPPPGSGPLDKPVIL